MVGSRDEQRAFVAKQATEQACADMSRSLSPETIVDWNGSPRAYGTLPANFRAYNWTMNIVLAREEALKNYDDGHPAETL